MILIIIINNNNIIFLYIILNFIYVFIKKVFMYISFETFKLLIANVWVSFGEIIPNIGNKKPVMEIRV